MPKKKQTPKNTQSVERDSIYFLKLVIYTILGLTWIHFTEPLHIGNVSLYGIPIGLVIGLVVASHDHFQVDRKIEYAILVIATIIGFVVPYLGIFI